MPFVRIFLIILVVLVISWIGFGRFFQSAPAEQANRNDQNSSSETNTSASISIQPDFTPITATFEIYTHGTKRVFTQAMYHRQSSNVYIDNPDPSLIHVESPQITWDDFFQTLPFSLTKQCLVTGTNQTFCSSETEQLKFFLNETEDPNALDRQIEQDDFLRVEFGGG